MKTPGKLGLSLFFLVFFAAGALFVWLTLRDALAGLQTWRWPQTTCEILDSRVDGSEETGQRIGNFTLEVHYRYSFAGQTHTSDRYAIAPTSDADYGTMARLADRYRPGTRAVCYVNPSSPSEAVLARGKLLSCVWVLFPMIFVVVGAGGLYFTWRRRPAESARRPISGPVKGQWAYAFFAVFLLVGCGTFYGLFLRPVSRILQARSWPAVPCTVIASEVKRHSDSDGTTYSVMIFYRYVFQDREFKANRYHFMVGSSSGYNGKRAVVDRYPAGADAICYVNPQDPFEAVLERGFTPDLWFGLLPLLFVAAGGGGLIVFLRKRRAGSGGTVGATAGAVPDTPAGQVSGTLELKPKMSRLGS